MPPASPTSSRPFEYSGFRLKAIGSAADRSSPTWFSSVNSQLAGALRIQVRKRSL